MSADSKKMGYKTSHKPKSKGMGYSKPTNTFPTKSKQKKAPPKY